MIDIPDLTPELLAELGKELGGCDFTHPSQTNFWGAGRLAMYRRFPATERRRCSPRSSLSYRDPGDRGPKACV